jgi:hypothetical protein
MKDNTKHIIARLKRQPRQGLPDTPNMFDAYTRGVADMTSEANTTIGITGKLTDTVRENAEAFLTAANKMNWYEEANKNLQKSYGLSIGKAAEFGFELDSSQDFLIKDDMTPISLEEIEAINKAKEDEYKSSQEFKIQEAKTYLLSTDYKMTVDYFATLTVEEQDNLIKLRTEARQFIRDNEK